MSLLITFDRKYQPWQATDLASPRPSLAGVLIDPAGYLVATNGFILAIVPCTITGEWQHSKDTLVPAWWLKIIAEASTGPAVSFTVQDGKARFTQDERVVSLVDATFPRWHKLFVPIGKPDTHVTLDPRLLSRLAAALGVSGQSTLLFTNGPLAAIYVAPLDSEALGLLMPMSQPVDLERLQKRISTLTDETKVLP